MSMGSNLTSTSGALLAIHTTTLSDTGHIPHKSSTFVPSPTLSSGIISSDSGGAINMTNSLPLPPSITPNTTPPTRLNLTESGDMNLWISSSAGIIIGIILLEIVFLLIVIICRKHQISKKEKAEEQNVFIVRKLPLNRSESYDLIKAAQKSKNDPSNSVTTTSVTVAPVDTHHDHTSNEPCSRSSAEGEGKVVDTVQERQPEQPLRQGSRQTDPAARMSTFGHPVSAWEDIEGGDNGHTQASDSNPKQKTSDSKVKPSHHDVQPQASNVNMEFQMPVADNSGGLKKLESESKCVFDELDALQHEMRILSQSIPMLDTHTYEKVTLKQTPKVSKSIPTLLDTDGYEDLDHVRAQTTKVPPRQRDCTKTERIDDTSVHKLQTASARSEEFLQSAFSQNQPQTTAALHKAKSVDNELGGKRVEPVYSVVQKRPKQVKATREEEGAEPLPPPVPPQTDRMFYTAQKPTISQMEADGVWV